METTVVASLLTHARLPLLKIVLSRLLVGVLKILSNEFGRHLESLQGLRALSGVEVSHLLRLVPVHDLTVLLHSLHLPLGQLVRLLHLDLTDTLVC